MDNDERRHYVQDRVAICEKKLKRYILNYYTYNGGETVGKGVLSKDFGTKYAYIAINPKANPVPVLTTCKMREMFDHSMFIMYFSTLKKIITDNWTTLGQTFSDNGITKAKFTSCMEDLNAGRTDADHYDAEDMTCPNEWEISDHSMKSFVLAYETLSKVFESLSL